MGGVIASWLSFAYSGPNVSCYIPVFHWHWNLVRSFCAVRTYILSSVWSSLGLFLIWDFIHVRKIDRSRQAGICTCWRGFVWFGLDEFLSAFLVAQKEISLKSLSNPLLIANNDDCEGIGYAVQNLLLIGFVLSAHLWKKNTVTTLPVALTYFIAKNRLSSIVIIPVIYFSECPEIHKTLLSLLYAWNARGSKILKKLTILPNIWADWSIELVVRASRYTFLIDRDIQTRCRIGLNAVVYFENRDKPCGKSTGTYKPYRQWNSEYLPCLQGW